VSWACNTLSDCPTAFTLLNARPWCSLLVFYGPVLSFPTARPAHLSLHDFAASFFWEAMPWACNTPAPMTMSALVTTHAGGSAVVVSTCFLSFRVARLGEHACSARLFRFLLGSGAMRLQHMSSHIVGCIPCQNTPRWISVCTDCFRVGESSFHDLSTMRCTTLPFSQLARAARFQVIPTCLQSS
jgi:hypothetical protein